MRTFLTVLGVSVGIGAVLFLVSLGYGLQQAILSRITTEESLLSLDVISGPAELIVLNDEGIEKIKAIPEIEAVSPVVTLTGQISLGDFTGDGTINIVDPMFFRLSGVVAMKGDVFKEENNHEIVISSAGVSLFNKEIDKVIGEKIKLSLFIPRKTEEGFEDIEVVRREQEYTIVGVLEDENLNYVYIPRNTVSDLQFDQYNQVKAKVSSEEFLEKSRTDIIEIGFLVSSLSDTIEQTKKIFGVIQIILALFGLIALIVSAIGMFNTMTITLLERINEIGIMRAVGVSSRDIQKMFLLESVLMGFLGGIGGVVIGYLGGEFANFGLNVLAKNFGGQAIDIFYRPLWFIAFIIIFSTVIGFLTGVYPSVRASKLNPLDALRYK